MWGITDLRPTGYYMIKHDVLFRSKSTDELLRSSINLKIHWRRKEKNKVINIHG